MKVVVQRVSRGSVQIHAENYSAVIGPGMVILLGIKNGDSEADASFLAEKCANLRIFEDAQGKMNVNIIDAGGSALIISQFTLYGDAQRGNRPSFSDAARPETAIPLYEFFIESLKRRIGAEKIRTGIFGAMMSVEIINDGPVTIIIDSK